MYSDMTKTRAVPVGGGQAIGNMVVLAVLRKMSFEGVSLLEPVGLGCWALLALRLGLITMILVSPSTCWAQWREAVFCAARVIDGVITVYTHGSGLRLAAESASNRWSTWLTLFVFQGGHWVNCLGVCLIYRLRFTTELFLLAAHVGAGLSTMKWALLDPAVQHYSDYLERGTAWCLGMPGARCLAVATWLRLLLVGFMLPLYFLFRQELRQREQFVEDARWRGRGNLDLHMDQVWCLTFVYVMAISTLVGQGHPVSSLMQDLL
jgi:hypothetical protein